MSATYFGASVLVIILSIYSLLYFDDVEELQSIMRFNQFIEAWGWVSSESPQSSSESGSLFTKTDLSNHKYEYLAIVGEVFDVRKGSRHYGKGGGYAFFTGLDGTRAYASGDFTEAGLIEDISGLDSPAIHAIEDFRLMYRKDYIYLGNLVGHFYDKEGNPTEHRHLFTRLLKQADQEKKAADNELKIYPPCNSESKGGNARVWCSNKSGGVTRQWTGVPRKYYKPGQADYRCACVKSSGPPASQPQLTNHKDRGDLDNPNMRSYGGCEPMATSCQVKK